MNILRPTPSSAASRSRLAALALVAAFAAACGGGGGGGGDNAPSPSPTPSPSPSPSPPPPAPAPPSISAAIDLNDNHQVGVKNWDDGNTANGGKGETVQGVPCEAPDETYHIHTHVSILVDGQAYAIPADVGLVETAALDCHYRIHTHDLSGKIHVEAPAPFTATLGQLFAIWGQPLSRSNVAGITGKTVVAWVYDNDTVTRWEGDLADIRFTSHRHIALQIGTPVEELPYFTWSAD